MRQGIRLGMAGLVFSLAGGILSAESFVYDSHGRRNPFLPPVEEKKQEEIAVEESVVDIEPFRAWFIEHTSGVLFDPENPRVLIGDEIVEIGEEVNGCTIVEIRPDGFVFIFANQRVEVPLRRDPERERR
ncbi:MAG: hypothetical protein IT574_05190 [Candidatus Aureabacteria bacterium]|nr:hypothetical protein [Candidatus Auribacterota bacterium]